MLSQVIGPSCKYFLTHTTCGFRTNHSLNFIPIFDYLLLLILPLIGSIEFGVSKSPTFKLQKIHIWIGYLISLIFVIIGSCLCNQMESPTIAAIIFSFCTASFISFVYNHIYSEYCFLQVQLVELRAAESVMKKELNEDHNSQLRHMIANLAHDLKTPLTALIGTLELMRNSFEDLKHFIKKHRGEDDVASIDESLNSLDSINSMMLMIINRCIDYVKASKGLNLVPQLDTLSIPDILHPMIKCVKQFHEENNITSPVFTFELNKPIRIFYDGVFYDYSTESMEGNSSVRDVSLRKPVGVSASDRSHLTDFSVRQANSLNRFSIKHNNNSRNSFCEEDGNHQKFLIFEVIDNGVGLSSELLSRLFKPIYDSTDIDEEPDPMRIMSTIIEEQVKNNDDSYKFTVRNPASAQSPSIKEEGICKPEAADSDNQSVKLRQSIIVIDPKLSHSNISQSASIDPKMSTSRASKMLSSPMNILVLDDSRPILKTIARSLEVKGHHVNIAFDGRDGFEIQRYLENGAETCHTVWITAYSANSDSETRLKSLECGADSFAGKPIKIDDLLMKYEQFKFAKSKSKSILSSNISEMSRTLRIRSNK
eukprot:gene11018-14797_t